MKSGRFKEFNIGNLFNSYTSVIEMTCIIIITIISVWVTVM